MKEFIVLLGGAGYNPESPRFRKAIQLCLDNPDAILVTTGLGICQKTLFYERAVMGMYAKKYLSWEKIVSGLGGNPVRRNTQDDILQAFNNPLLWLEEDSHRIVFITEGRIHAFRVKKYAQRQLPHLSAQIICADSGEKIAWNRTVKEVGNLLKLAWWMIKKAPRRDIPVKVR